MSLKVSNCSPNYLTRGTFHGMIFLWRTDKRRTLNQGQRRIRRPSPCPAVCVGGRSLLSSELYRPDCVYVPTGGNCRASRGSFLFCQ